MVSIVHELSLRKEELKHNAIIVVEQTLVKSQHIRAYKQNLSTQTLEIAYYKFSLSEAFSIFNSNWLKKTQQSI